MKRFIASICVLALGAALAPAEAAYPEANAPPPGAPPAPPAEVGDLGMAIMSARVNSDGSLAAGEGATSSSLISAFPGAYQVDFGRDVTRCVYSVTPFFDARPFAEPRSGAPNAVFVQTNAYNSTSGQNTPFYLLVYCGR